MADSKKIIVCSKLPFGLILEAPKNPNVKIELKGLNSSKVSGATHFETEVDAEFWAAWKEKHKAYPALINGSIFEAKTKDEAGKKAEEFEEKTTGLEPMEKDALGVKPAEKD